MGAFPISYSKARRFQECPARFKAEYLDKVDAAKPLPMLVGIFLHELADQWLKQHLDVQHPMEPVDMFFRRQWAAERGDIPFAMFEELYDLFGVIAKEVVKADPAKVVASELSLAVDANWEKVDWDADTAHFRGKLDKLEMAEGGKAIVWDLKTGYSMEDAADSMQLKSYGAMILALLRDVHVVEAKLYYPRFNTTRSYTLTAKDAEAARQWVADIKAAVVQASIAQHWPEKPGRACMDCPVFETCAARKRVGHILPPSDYMAAVDLLERLILVESERASLQEKLRVWVSANGPVETGGMIIGYNPVRKLEYDVATLKALAERVGVNFMAIIKADTTALQKIAKKNTLLQKELEAIAVDKSTTSFKLVKGGAQ